MDDQTVDDRAVDKAVDDRAVDDRAVDEAVDDRAVDEAVGEAANDHAADDQAVGSPVPADLEATTPRADWPRTLVALAKVGVSAGAAVGTGAARRVLEGPMVPGWSWSVELTRAAVSQLMGGIAGGNMDPPTLRGVERIIDMATQVVWPPIGYRRSLSVTLERDAPVPGDWIHPVGYTYRGVILYLHGGGYLGGSPWTHRGFTSKLSMRTSTGVFVPEYRLAPQHPFPAAVEDALACYRHMLSVGVPAERIMVAGDSAGGGLAAALGVALRDEGLPQPAGYSLISPEIDLTLTGDSIAANARTDILPEVIPTDGYVGAAEPTDPLVSPLYADLRGLAPMLIQIGGREMLHDGQAAFARKAADAGVEVWLHDEPEMFHVWPMLVPQLSISVAALSRIVAFTEHRLGPLPLEAAPGRIDGLTSEDQPADLAGARRATAVAHRGSPISATDD
ncbi:MAG: alpha/beta hydrolase fold domain-containing protein [Acidimicrobiia bacterium]|nr:alpha/beta hydrolase fold domain-containing protein [Acidimicrobiia bacterium]